MSGGMPHGGAPRDPAPSLGSRTKIPQERQIVRASLRVRTQRSSTVTGMRVKTVEHDPFIKSQLASRNQLEDRMGCKFGHVTHKILRKRTSRSPTCRHGRKESYHLFLGEDGQVISDYHTVDYNPLFKSQITYITLTFRPFLLRFWSRYS